MQNFLKKNLERVSKGIPGRITEDISEEKFLNEFLRDSPTISLEEILKETIPRKKKSDELLKF